jgi:glutamine synthetase
VPAEEIARRGIRLLPGNLLDAVRNLVTDDVLRTALGTTDRGDYIDYFASVKEAEWNEYHEQVSDWETKRYLGLF